MYVYHFWIWRYRLLDVGPRRLMRSAKWQSSRNMLIVLVVLYIAVPILLWYNMVLFAGTEPCTNNSYTSAKENAFRPVEEFCIARWPISWVLRAPKEAFVGSCK
jgi:hypothetical protein